MKSVDTPWMFRGTRRSHSFPTPSLHESTTQKWSLRPCLGNSGLRTRRPSRRLQCLVGWGGWNWLRTTSVVASPVEAHFSDTSFATSRRASHGVRLVGNPPGPRGRASVRSACVCEPGRRFRHHLFDILTHDLSHRRTVTAGESAGYIVMVCLKDR